MDDALRHRIQDLVSKNEVLLFMKGTRHFPQCGFSSQVVAILNELGPKYETVNILADGALRDGMKEFSSWPTFPQLYVKGAFVGGCDIVKEMHGSGELGTLLGSAGSAEGARPPSIEISEGAARAFRDAVGDSPEDVLRLEVTPDFQYDLHVGPKVTGDVEVKSGGGITLHVAAGSAGRADGMRIDFVTDAKGAGFKIENPNEPPRVKSLSVEDLKAWLDARGRGEKRFELLDVRPDAERTLASIAGAKPLGPETEQSLADASKDTALVFHCHHGMRSRNAAEHFLRQGFKNVYNVEGGIDAWSQRVDPTVSRY
ncbi:MAG TPA: Grx4 family monothiol glutaredoxin [Polyangiaceae bacterium]|jgi:monothiol glutaredoxin